ncbi:MAG: LytTR family DNA-binding domain-containing protein [Bacillota bacterium]|nr:LytTR family DNA-binding domain-containing protein [Bacillota bacterium]
MRSFLLSVADRHMEKAAEEALSRLAHRGLWRVRSFENEQELFSFLSKGRSGGLPVVTKKSSCRVPLDQIHYISKDQRKVLVHTASGELSFYGKFSEIEPYLGEEFVCCHQSYIVNMEKVKRRAEQSFHMEDGTVLPISQKRYGGVRKRYEDFLRKSLKK